MRRRSLIPVVILNVIVSLAVVFLALRALNPGGSGNSESQIVITVPILVTATADPDATRHVVVVTATPLPGQPQGVGGLPTDIFAGATAVSMAATLDPERLADNPSLQGTVASLPDNCVLHTIASGDTPFGIAERYGTDGFTLMAVNALDDLAASRLQIGDTLIVPLAGCELAAASATEAPTRSTRSTSTSDDDDETEEATEAVNLTPSATPRPTLTLPPTATSASVEILQVISRGDVTAEGIEIQNMGDTVNIGGWKLLDGDGNEYVFSEQLLFSNARITIYSRSGNNTTVALFWGKDSSIWEVGDVVTLTNDRGVVQSTLRVPAAVDLR